LVETVTAENSGGLLGAEPTGKTHASTGPTTQQQTLADGAVLLVPKASIVAVRW